MTSRVPELENELNTVADIRREIDQMNEMAWRIRYDDRDHCLALSQQSYELATTGPFAGEPYYCGLAASLRNLGYLNSGVGKYDLALSQSLQAFNILETSSESGLKADVLANISWTYRGFGDYGVALDHGMNALKVAQELGDRTREASILDTIGSIYSEANNLEQAFATYRQAFQIFRELGDQRGESLVLNNLALAYLQAKDDSNALTTGLSALLLARENDISALVLTTLGTVGEIYLETGDYARAVIYLEQALDRARVGKVDYDEFWSLLNLGKAFHLQKDDVKALSFIDLALAITEKSSNRPGQFLCHELLAEIYESQSDLTRALAHYKQFHRLKETVFNEDVSKRLAGLQVIHQVETAKRDAEIQHLKTIELQKEIEDRKHVQAALEELATTDPLTGLLNRREFFTRAEPQVRLAQRDHRPLSAILLDFDHFKNINDTYGHAAGDQVLAVAARTIQDNLREDEIIARFGGDEFVILLPGSNLARASQIAKRLHDKMNSKIVKTERGRVSVATSLGVAEYRSIDGASLDALLDHADQALYTAKRAGRNRTATYQETD